MTDSQGHSPAQPEVRACSGHQLQPCLMYKARWPRTGQDRVTSGQWSSQAEAIWPICTSARLPSLCVSVLFSLFSPCISLTPSPSAPPSVYLCVCVCFSRVFMICPFSPPPPCLESGPQLHLTLSSHSTSYSIFTQPVHLPSVPPPPTSSTGAPRSCTPVLFSLGLRPLLTTNLLNSFHLSISGALEA